MNVPISEYELAQIIYRVPYEELSGICSISKAAQEICQNLNFWAEKAEVEFNIPISEFYSDVLANINPEQRYLQLRDYAMPMPALLLEIFNLGMYIKGWSGPGYPYPYEKSCYRDNEPIYVTLSKINDLYNILDERNQLIFNQLRSLDYDIETGNFIAGRSKHLINIIMSIQPHPMNRAALCASQYSSELIASSVYYLRELFDISLPNFDISLLS